MIKNTVAKFSKIDILIQNAAIGMKPRPLVDSSEELFDKLFNTNVKSIYLGAKQVIPQFILIQLMLYLILQKLIILLRQKELELE